MVKDKKPSIGGKIALGVAAGAIIGIAAGVLTAPNSGRETRRKTKGKVNDVIASTKAKLRNKAHK